ncbi:hypothetical protein HPB49_017190 [Dermacentor silvarum]|uniref:Uncharacterized protein n=1 Tax=Dermacentor silvarum TaxID=543639 RepID=A0ACB8DQF9_DERSI|nr:hypothetical protein HPB49_017190 [Dermacentor silvarum]
MPIGFAQRRSADFSGAPRGNKKSAPTECALFLEDGGCAPGRFIEDERAHQCAPGKCSIPCLNGGRCVGVNQCRCTRSFVGPQCAHRIDGTAAVQREHCQRRCVHGVCIRHNRCLCDEGFFGRRCARRRYTNALRCIAALTAFCHFKGCP